MDILVEIFRILMIGVGTGLTSIALEASKEDLPVNALLGSICYAAYLYTNKLFESPMLATFFASLLISFLAIYLTRKRKKPLQIFLVAGIIPLLPGLYIFKMVLALVDQEFSEVLINANATMQILAVIVISLVTASSVTKILKFLGIAPKGDERSKEKERI